MKRLGVLLVLLFSVSSFASGLDGYVRAREFATRFANVISDNGNGTYTIGREDDKARRLTVTPGSRLALVGTRKVTLDRGVKVDVRGLLIPPTALRYLGCSIAAKGTGEVMVKCDGTSYAIQRFAK